MCFDSLIQTQNKIGETMGLRISIPKNHRRRNHRQRSRGCNRGSLFSVWEDRLSELAEYRRIHGHCNVPLNCSENAKLATWVANQRKEYRSRVKGKTSHITPARIQELECLGFKWRVYVTTWEDRLRELADYRRIHGHCNIPRNYSESSKLANWVANQRMQYKWHLDGNTSTLTPPVSRNWKA
jgi:hypothetical protein